MFKQTPGQVLSYVVDAGHVPGNIERILAVAHKADVLYIEATFLDTLADEAAKRKHLTARQAGTLARQAGVAKVVPFHFSPRHENEIEAVHAEVQAAFEGE